MDLKGLGQWLRDHARHRGLSAPAVPLKPFPAFMAALVGVVAALQLHENTHPTGLLPPGGALVPVQPGFLWGVATAGHQWEGGDATSNWARWEKAGHVVELPGPAADGWHRYADDMDLAKGMGLNAWRMSIEWSRIEPRPGEIDRDAVERYHAMLEAAHARGLTPIITLLHYAYPAWLDDLAPPGQSAWETDEAVERYVRYVDFVAREFGSDIRYYLTFNEPTVMVEAGYLAGVWPPGKKDLGAFLKASANLIKAHSRAYDRIHLLDRDAQVGFNNYAAAYQLSLDPAADAMPAPGDDWFLKAFANVAMPNANRAPKLDFIAVDYYKRLTIPTQLIPPSPSQWHIFPEGFDEVLVRYYKVFHLPILVAENGLATDNGRPRNDGWTREAYIAEHVAQLQRTMARGVPVIGYTYWTLTDNYEWGSFNDRFGLYEVDCRRGSFTRVPTPAVEAYKAIVAARGVTPDLLARYGYKGAEGRR